MNAGDLDRRVQFQRALPMDDGLSITEVFSDHGTPVWASRKDISDGERWRAAAVSSLVTARFQVRWTPFAADITVKDRIRCEGVDYNLTGIKEIGRRERIEFSASAER